MAFLFSKQSRKYGNTVYVSDFKPFQAFCYARLPTGRQIIPHEFFNLLADQK